MEVLTEVKYTKKDEDDTCSICVEDFKQGETVTETKCKHQFHTNCIWQWVETKIAYMLNELEEDEPVQYDCVECPLCNTSFARDGLA